MNEIPEVLQKWKTHYFAPLGIELRKTLSQVLVAIEAHQRADHRLLEALICLNAGGIAINPARWLTEAQLFPALRPQEFLRSVYPRLSLPSRRTPLLRSSGLPKDIRRRRCLRSGPRQTSPKWAIRKSQILPTEEGLGAGLLAQPAG